MNLQFYLEKLFASEEFQNFMKENPSAYFCSGFISIDKENNGNKIHIDYIIPETKKIFSFQLEGKVDMIPVEQSGNTLLEKIPDNIDFSFEEIEKMIEDKMKEQESGRHQAYPSIRRTGAKIQKILLSLQKIDKKDFLIGTVFISGLGMIKVKIDLDLEHRSVYPNVQNFGAKIVEFEKKSFFDMMKIIKK